jgi:hypothetical protein
MEEKAEVETPYPFICQRCIRCGKTETVELTLEEITALRADLKVPDALPNRDSDFRELIITGIHAECWEAIFG